MLQDEEIVTRKTQFFIDMCKAMVAVNMSWRSLENEVWRSFLIKYTKQDILNESTLRKNYLDDCYKIAMQNIKNIVENYVWVSIDETTDKIGRYVANLLGKCAKVKQYRIYFLVKNWGKPIMQAWFDLSIHFNKWYSQKVSKKKYCYW